MAKRVRTEVAIGCFYFFPGVGFRYCTRTRYGLDDPLEEGCVACAFQPTEPRGEIGPIDYACISTACTYTRRAGDNRNVHFREYSRCEQ